MTIGRTKAHHYRTFNTAAALPYKNVSSPPPEQAISSFRVFVISKCNFVQRWVAEGQEVDRSAPRPAPRAATPKKPPRPARSAPPPAPVKGGGSVLGGIGSTIVDGVAFGTGSAIAHRAVDAVLGPRIMQHEMVAPPASSPGAAPVSGSTYLGSDACETRSKAFQDCINYYGSDISKCQFYLDMLNECRRGSGTALGA